MILKLHADISLVIESAAQVHNSFKSNASCQQKIGNAPQTPVAKIIIFISLKAAIYFPSIATLTSPSFFPVLNIAVIYPRFPALLKPAACPPQIPVSITKYCRCSIFHIHSIIPFPFPHFICTQHQLPPSQHITPQRFNWLCRGRKI